MTNQTHHPAAPPIKLERRYDAAIEDLWRL
jgi:hypothetical protein